MLLTWQLIAVSVMVTLAESMTGAYFPVLFRESGWSVGMLSWILALGSAVTLAFTPPTGYISDRVPARLLMPVGLAGIATAYFCLAISRTLFSFVVHVVLKSTSSAIFQVVFLYSLAQVVPRHREGTYLGLNRALSQGAETLGVMLGGFQYAANQSLPFVTSAGITFATVIGTLMITRHPAFASPVKQTERRQPPAASAIKPWVFVLLFTAVLFMGASFQATRFISLYVTEVAGRSAAELGTFFSLLTGLYALTFPLFGRLLDRSRLPLALLGIGYAGRLFFYGALPLAFASPYPHVLVLATLPYSMVVLAQQKALFYIAPAAWRGRIFSLQRVALLLAPMIASPIYGAVWEALGPTSVFSVACVFLVASAPALCYAYLVAVRHMKGKEPTQSELQ